MAENTFKSEPQDASPDPLEGKSIDELKELVKGLQEKNAEYVKIINKLTTIIQVSILQMKERGLDLQTIGRNAENTLIEEMKKLSPQQQLST